MSLRGARPMKPVFLAAALALACSLAGHGAGPPPEKIDLFTAGDAGYALYRIPGVVVTARGTVLAYCEARRTGKSDWDAIDIVLRRSTDGGQTWEAATKVADVPGPKSKNPVALAQKLGHPDDVTYNNAVAIAARDGTVHFLFCLEYARCFYQRSNDDSVTWTRPVEITAAFERLRRHYDWNVIATGPGHGIELANGRLVGPVWLSTTPAAMPTVRPSRPRSTATTRAGPGIAARSRSRTRRTGFIPMRPPPFSSSTAG